MYSFKKDLKVCILCFLTFVFVLCIAVCSVWPIYITHNGVLVFDEKDGVRSYILCQPVFSDSSVVSVDFLDYDCFDAHVVSKQLLTTSFAYPVDIEYGSNVVIKSRVADSVFEYLYNLFIIWKNEAFLDPNDLRFHPQSSWTYSSEYENESHLYRLAEESHAERLVLRVLPEDDIIVESVLSDDLCDILRQDEALQFMFDTKLIVSYDL